MSQRKVVEVDESVFLESQGLVQAVNGMLANKEARALLLKARKIADPSAPVPEIDAAEPVNAELAKIHEQQAKILKRMDDEAAAREAAKRNEEFAKTWEGQKAALRAQGFTDDGIAAVEKHAHQRGIPDLEVAAAHWERLNPPPAPVENQGAYGAFNFFEPQEEGQHADYMKKLLETKGENDAITDNYARTVLREIRGQQGRK